MSPQPYLPPELVGIIVSMADAQDLPAWRLVSKAVCDDATTHFGRAYFSDVAFMFSRYSLEHLVELTAHPLGRYIENLTFGTFMLVVDPEEWRNGMRFHEDSPQMIEAFEDYEDDSEWEVESDSAFYSEEDGIDSDEEPAETQNPSLEEAHTERQNEHPEGLQTKFHIPRRKAILDYFGKFDITGEFCYSGQAVQLIAQAFTNLKTYNRKVTLGYVEDISRFNKRKKVLEFVRKPYGFDEFWKGRPNPRTFPSLMPDARFPRSKLIFRWMLDAAEAADYPVLSMLFDRNEFETMWPETSLEEIRGPLEKWLFKDTNPEYKVSSEQNETRLRDGIEWHVNSRLRKGTLTKLHVSAAERKFSFSTQDFKKHKPEAEQWALLAGLSTFGINEDLNTHGFREISLVACRMKLEHLNKFLHDESESLRILRLANFETIDEPNSESKPSLALLRMLKNGMTLDSLTLKDVRFQSSASVLGQCDQEFDGVQEVQVGLQWFIDIEEACEDFV